jgi:monothiol glutaredoxin
MGTNPEAEIARITAQIEQDISDNLVFVYAKGEKNMAACGFSHRVMEIFNRLGEDFAVRNVLADPAIRQAVCAYTHWPTIPQVFIGGKFIGGCDILTEMCDSGELQETLRKAREERAGAAR